MAFDHTHPLGLPGLDHQIGFASVKLTDALPPLLEAEQSLLTDGVAPKRRTEIQAGRHAAHLAMEDLGFPASPVMRAPSRAPIWPTGLTGSISHNDVYAVSIVSKLSAYRSLGIDIEESEALDRDLWSVILHESELENLGNHPLPEALSAKVVFSAKESLFKALFPLTGQFLDFQDVCVELDFDRLEFNTSPARQGINIPSETQGSFHVSDEMILSLVRVLP